jgi:hypothetical protein
MVTAKKQISNGGRLDAKLENCETMTDDEKIAPTAEIKRCNERLNLIDQDDHLRSGVDSIRTVEILLSLRDQVGSIRDQIGLFTEMLPDIESRFSLENQALG